MPGKPRQPRKRTAPAKPAADARGVTECSAPGAVQPAAEKPRTVDGRPACYLVDECGLPEFMDNVGLCGRHWALRPDVRKVARRG